MNGFDVRPPLWFWIVSALILLWGAAGIFSFYSDVTMSEDAIAAMSAYDRQLYLSRPGWVEVAYACATWGGLLGGALLLLRRRAALFAFVVSFVAVIAQFGWAFGATDLIATKGVSTAFFPLFIIAIALFQLWFARTSTRRGWLR